jgi:hypothetical protein
MSDWQPIETAPKDGSNILGWSKEFGLQILHYGLTEWEDGSTEEAWLFFSDFQTWPSNPTHWVAIPKQPTK